MMRSSAVFLLFFVLIATCCWSADVKDPYLGEGQVLCVVEFAPDSDRLDAASRQAVDQALKKMQLVDMQSHLIRIEGYARASEAESAALAIARAEAVEEFLRFARKNYEDRYLTGIILNDGRDSSGRSPYRAEIVVYDNIFAAAGTPFKITSKESR